MTDIRNYSMLIDGAWVDAAAGGPTGGGPAART